MLVVVAPVDPVALGVLVVLVLRLLGYLPVVLHLVLLPRAAASSAPS